MGEPSFDTQLQVLGAEELQEFKTSLAHYQGLKAPNARSRTSLMNNVAKAFGSHSETLLPVFTQLLDQGLLPDAANLGGSMEVDAAAAPAVVPAAAPAAAAPGAMEVVAAAPAAPAAPAPAASASGALPAPTDIPVTLNVDPSTITVAPASFNVFLGDLHGAVTEEELQGAFGGCGQILEVRIIRDKITQQCKGYGFIHFATAAGKEASLSSAYANVSLGGRVVRVKASEQKVNLFVGNLPMANTAEQIERGLLYALSQIATPDNFSVDIKTSGPPDQRPRGYGFIAGSSSSISEAAKVLLAGVVLNGRPINVNWAESTTQADAASNAASTTLYVSGMNSNLTEDVLQALFSQFGDTNKCVIMKQPQSGASRGYGFVGFETREECDAAIAGLNDQQFQGKALQVSIAKAPSNKKTPRQQTQSYGSWGAPQYGAWGQAGAGAYGAWQQPQQQAYGAYPQASYGAAGAYGGYQQAYPAAAAATSYAAPAAAAAYPGYGQPAAATGYGR
eukprot:TRINITY_DN5984_c0_g1_i1.p1 TRINITY_DN5984_c0_g1~~TRINITY_DN5984_c0_g1_i1.p1  ORF type:complete len:515 (-),score=152.40 TRINITY_DN5984_c0_g1_i1:74-1591(-)